MLSCFFIWPTDRWLSIKVKKKKTLRIYNTGVLCFAASLLYDFFLDAEDAEVKGGVMSAMCRRSLGF